jgi:acetyltransferase
VIENNQNLSKSILHYYINSLCGIDCSNMDKTLNKIFKPKSIAVIGASKRKDSLGYIIVDNLIKSDFNGTIYPVNPKGEVIHSLRSYKSVLEIPDEVDLAIVVVPKEKVFEVVDECGKKGIKGLVTITAGFKEVGGAGIEREKQLVEKIKSYGMRMIGPNCMGVINTDPEIKMNATFSPVSALEGNIAFMSQSGALGVVILGFAREINLGFSQFASVGNKANISGNDLLEYWKDDSRTQVILLYLESFGNPRHFTQLAREITKKKPIIAVKAGRTLAGAKAVSSHTGVLAGIDLAVDALFEQCGVIRVTSIEELFDLSLAFTGQPIPKGNRIAILTNAGGPGIMATDACVSLGLELAQFSNETKEKLKKGLPEEASVNNPVDMIASANEESYRHSLDCVLDDPNVDSVLVIFVTPPASVSSLKVAKSILEVREKYSDKPVLGCLMGKEEIWSGIQELKKHKIPIYTFPEGAAKALSSLEKYRRWINRPEGKIKTFVVDKEKVKNIIEKAKQEKRSRLTDEEVRNILQIYGFPLTKSALTKNIDSAIEFYRKIKSPVVLKVTSKKIVHKSDIGGVIVDLRNESELKDGYQKIKMNLEKHNLLNDIDGITIQEMVKGGKETILGMTVDPSFGPLIMFGLGGVYVEVLKDVSFKVLPITDIDAKEMIASIKGYEILKGIRGELPVDMDILVESLQRLSQLVMDFDEIIELDMNPFIVSSEKENCKIVDARMSIKI